MKHLFYPLLALPVLLAAGNLLPDASFELGGADYAKLRYARPMQPEEVKYLPPVPDQSTRVHGRQSLRFDNPDATPAVLRSPDFSVTPGKPYTLSFYAKSSKPVKLRYLPISIRPEPSRSRPIGNAIPTRLCRRTVINRTFLISCGAKTAMRPSGSTHFRWNPAHRQRRSR